MLLRTLFVLLAAWFLSPLADRVQGQPPGGRTPARGLNAGEGQRIPRARSAQLDGRQQVPAGVAAGQRGALAPSWVPLPPDHQKRVDEILDYWEFKTQGVKRYRCEFKRWEYEPELKTYAEGEIKYAAPDKGLFKTRHLMNLIPPRQAGDKPVWERDEEFLEHWVCDGKSVYEFDYRARQVKVKPLPAEMQGQRIADGPLPFLFGARKNQMKERFWIRQLPPPDGVENEYWLEVVPKTQRDAADARKMRIIIAAEDYRPKGLILYHRNQSRTTFIFEKRESDWNILPDMLRFWQNEFFEPKTPRGWKRVVERAPAARQPAQGNPATTRRTAVPTRR